LFLLESFNLVIMNRLHPYSRAGGPGYSIFSNQGYGPQAAFGFPNNSSSNQETKKCSTHGKRRTVKNLVKNDDGKWVCCSGSECKTVTTTVKPDSDSGETAKCVLHGKTRTIANLGKDHNGDWVCLGSSICKNGGRGGSGRSGNQPGSFGMFHGPPRGGWGQMGYGGPFCAVHGKKRTIQNLTRNQLGDWVCLPGSRCKMMAGDQLRDGSQVKICSVHGKQRSASNMEEGEDGEWVCIEKYRCKVVPAGAKAAGEQMCSIHNKSRSTPNLKQTEDGEWVCIDGSMCK